MSQKKYGGEDFGSTLEELKKLAPLAVTMEGVSFNGPARKVGAILALAGVGVELIAEIERLRAEEERLRMQLVACGVVAMSNTPESAAKSRDMHPDYMSASCQDVIRIVDKEMASRADAERFSIIRAMMCNEAFQEAFAPLIIDVESAEDPTVEQLEAQFDLHIKIATDAGLWPIKTEAVQP